MLLVVLQTITEDGAGRYAFAAMNLEGLLQKAQVARPRAGTA